MLNKRIKSEFSQVYPEYSSLPEKITTEFPFVAIGDIAIVTGKISPIFLKDPKIGNFQHRLLQLQKKYAPKGSTFYYIPQQDLVREIEAKVEKAGKREGVINFDRYIFQKDAPKNYIRLELSRGADNQLVVRPGSTVSKEDQIKTLESWLRLGRFKKIVFVDDVVAFATTFPPIIEIIRKILPDVEISVVAGICSSKGIWSGKEKLEQLKLSVDAVVIAEASAAIEGSTSGMAIPDSRDSTIFGGKVGVLQDGRALSYPYFYPFSVPTTSLMSAETRKKASLEWIDFNINLVSHINRKMKRQLLISDLIANGFGIPYTSIEEFRQDIPVPDNNMSMLQYLKFIRSTTPRLLKKIKK